MPNICTVCNRNSKKNRGVSYFQYPQDQVKRIQWLHIVGRQDLILKTEEDKTRKSLRICGHHFEADYIKYSKKGNAKYLCKNAYPSLNLSSNYDSSIRYEEPSQNRTTVSESSWTTTLQQDVLRKLPESEVLIANVHRYLQKEYEYLKIFTGNSLDLSPLQNILKRTADATGVSEKTVAAVLMERQRSDRLFFDGVQSKRAKPSQNFQDYDVSFNQDDLTTHVIYDSDDGGQMEEEIQPIETCVLEIEVDQAVEERVTTENDPFETTSTAQHLLTSEHVDVKPEPYEEDHEQSSPASSEHHIIDCTFEDIKTEPQENFSEMFNAVEQVVAPQVPLARNRIEYCTYNMERDQPTELLEPVARRPRGRPRKHSILPDIPKVKRPRGRPRKIHNPFPCGESSSEAIGLDASPGQYNAPPQDDAG